MCGFYQQYVTCISFLEAEAASTVHRRPDPYKCLAGLGANLYARGWGGETYLLLSLSSSLSSLNLSFRMF